MAAAIANYLAILQLVACLIQSINCRLSLMTQNVSCTMHTACVCIYAFYCPILFPQQSTFLHVVCCNTSGLQLAIIVGDYTKVGKKLSFIHSSYNNLYTLSLATQLQQCCFYVQSIFCRILFCHKATQLCHGYQQLLETRKYAGCAWRHETL